MQRILTLFLALSLFTASSQAQTATDFTVTDVHGQTHNLYDYLNNGKHVLIKFFAAYCPFCQASVPDINAAYEKYGCNQEDLIVLSISLRDNDARVRQFDNNHQVRFPSISAVEGGGSDVAADYNILSYPAYRLIQPDKSIQNVFPSSSIEGRLRTENLKEVTNCNMATNTSAVAATRPTMIHTAYEVRIQNLPAALPWRVIDATGREMAAGQTSTGDWTLPINDWSTGLYVLQIRNENSPWSYRILR